MSLHVLIIDDDADFRRILSLRLRSFLPDLTLLERDSIEEARRFLNQEERPSLDLVIMDQHLPDGKGTDLLKEGWFENDAVLSVSSDSAPEIPGESMTAGAAFFLTKRDVSQPLFEPLARGLIERNKIQRELTKAAVNRQVIEMVRTHIGTLRHEINNPLGAVLGAAYLLRNSDAATPDQQQAAELVEKSGKRIKNVLDQICTAMESEQPLEPVMKAHHKVFHIPGDKPWEED